MKGDPLHKNEQKIWPSTSCKVHFSCLYISLFVFRSRNVELSALKMLFINYYGSIIEKMISYRKTEEVFK